MATPRRVPPGLRRLGSTSTQRIRDLGQRWLHKFIKPARAACLLPVHLQTAFVPPTVERPGWRMQLLVTPDAIFFDDHDRVVSASELELLHQAYLRSDGDLSSDAGREAFRSLARQVGGGRAAWLCGRFPPGPEHQPTKVPEDPPADRQPRRTVVRGLPARLEVWLGRSGNRPTHVATMQVDRGALNPELGGERGWLSSFTEARKVGLGIELELGDVADDIDVVYVVGLSTGGAKTLFSAHRASGKLAVVASGTPTNSIAGFPGVDLDPNSDIWWRLAQERGHPESLDIGRALVGSETWGPVAGPTTSHVEPQRDIVEALFASMWGHPAATLWGFSSDRVLEAAQWASRYLRPAGPLPTVRIGNEPYGLLPVSAWESWQADANDPPVEAQLVPALVALMHFAAARSETEGNVVGANTDRTLELLARTAQSAGYSVRYAMPATLLSLATGSDVVAFERLLSDWATLPSNVTGADPARALVETIATRPVRIPLVDGATEDARDWKQALLELAELQSALSNTLLRNPGSLQVVSVLHQLAILSRLSVEAAVARQEAALPEPRLEPIAADPNSPTLLEQDGQGYHYVPPPAPTDSARDEDLRQRKAMKRLSTRERDEVEWALRNLLDTGSHRVDPFLIGVAWRRYLARVDSGSKPRIGAYGWVDAPRPDAADLDTEVIVAPSHDQLVTSMIARDAAIRHPDRHGLTIDSQLIREAKSLARDVSEGLHVAEALGYRIEAAVGDPLVVSTLRETYPLGTTGACDGAAVLEADEVEIGELMEGPELARVCEHMRAVVSAYADLGVLDGVHGIAQGRAEAAGAAMDGVAGLHRPPSLDVVSSPARGREISTAVLLLIEHRAAPGKSAVTIAEPALSTLLEPIVARFPATWRVGRQTFGLNQLDLNPSDLALISPEELSRLIQRRMGQRPDPTSSGIAMHERVVDLVSTLAIDFPDGRKLAWLDDGRTRQTLRERLQRLRRRATQTIALLRGRRVPWTTTIDPMTLIATWGIPIKLDTPTNAAITYAIDVLKRRLQANKVSPDAVDLDTLAQAVRKMAAGEAPLPILAPVPAGPPPVLRRARAKQAYEDWLSINATVRLRMANVEALLLDAELDGQPAPFHIRTNRPKDPWTRQPGEGLQVAFVAGPRSFVANEPTSWSVASIDGWTEVLPDSHAAGHGAIRFPGPPARAPQAILLASPPDDEELDAPGLVAIVANARRLARARASDPESIADATSWLPSACIPQANARLV